MRITEELKQSAIRRAKAGVSDIAGLKVLRMETLDGIKFFLENPACADKPNAAETWLLLRCEWDGAAAARVLRELLAGECGAGVEGG